MRYIFFFLSLLSASLLLAQSTPGHWCATGHDHADYELLKARLLENKAAIEAGIVTTRDVRYVPVKFHLAANDDGSGRIDENKVLDQLCELNEDFAPHDLQFFLADGSLNYIDDTDLYENHLAVQTSVMQRQRDSRALNIFIVDNANTGGSGSEGTTLAYYNIPRDWIVITDSYVRGNDATLSHEVGHFFSLLHTFNGYESDPHDTPNVNAPVFSPGGPRSEFADGSNCSSSGDFLCDTPADYNNGLGASSCDLRANILDPNGEAIDPDERNFLSYFLLCPDEEYHFSDDQVAMMNADYASTSRRYLALDPVPDVTPLGAIPTAIYPEVNGTSDFYDEITFEWTPTAGATSYLFELSRVSSFTIIAERQVVDGTSITINNNENLLADKRYYWRVRPFNAHVACTDVFPNRNVFTTSEVSVFATATTELNELASFQVAPNPVIGTDDLVLMLQAEQNFTAQLQILNLNGQQVQAIRQLEIGSGEQRIRVPLHALPNGVYYLRLMSDSGQATQKVVIAR